MNRRKMIKSSAVVVAAVPLVGCTAAIKNIAAKIAEIDYKFGMIYTMWEEYKAAYVDVRKMVIKNKGKLNLPPGLWAKLTELDNGLIEADKIIAEIKIGKDVAETEMNKVIQSAKTMAEIFKGALKIALVI